MADRKSDHLYTSPKSGDSRKPSPKRKDTGTPPPGDGKSTAHRSGKVGAHVVKKEADTGEHATRGRASPATGRHNSPSPVRGRPSEQISSLVHFQSGRNHSPNSRLEEGRSPVGVRHEQEYHSMRQASPYQHEISPHHLQQQQHLHMAAVSSLQQMERKYSPIPFSGYMEPKVILNRLEVAIPQEGRSPLGLERKVSHGDMRRFSPNPTYRHEQKLSPSTGASAPVELRVSPVSHVMESRLSPGPPHDQRPSSLSPLSSTDRRPSPAHMPERTSPMPTLGAHITPPPAHVPQQKPHKASPTVYVGPSGSPVEQSKLSPNSPTSTDAHLPQGAQGPQSSLSPGSHLHGDRSHLSPKPGFGGLGHIERKLSPSRDGRPSPSPLKAYLLQAVPASERRSPNRHMDTAERKLSPSAERHFSPSPIRVGLSPNEPFRHDLGVGGPLPRFSPNPHHSPSHSRTPGDQPLETLRIHVPHHAHGPVVRISPSGPGDVIAHHTPALPVGAVIGEDLKGHSPKSLHRPTPAMPRALASPPKGAPVPGKPLLSAHLGGAPFVPQGMYPSGPQPTPAFISQGLIMHAHAPPRVSAPLPSHQRPAPNPFSFPGTPQMDTPGKLPAPSQLSSITRPVAQTVAVAKPQSHSMRKAVSDITAIKSPRRTEDSDSEGMPRLTPEGPWPGILEEKRRPSFHLGLHQNQDNAETEYSALANPFSMRVQILNNFPTNSTLYRSAYRSQSVAMHRARCSCITSAAKSLDILRQNLQKAMNKEIDEIIQKYMEKFFKPGIENIKLNNGQNSVSEEHVHAVSRQILEEAKKMYISERPRSTTPVRDFPDNVSETGSSSGRIRIPSRRRRPSDSDSERSLPVKRKRKGRPPLNMSGRGTPSKTLKSHSPVRREGPKWETDRIKVDTLFVMGARANKALGLGATRGRLYIKHPDIFKYSGDQDDKQWLFDNHHMPATGGKAYMLMVEDIQELAKSDEYRDSPNLLLDEIIGFTVPEWMCEKMKIQMAAMRTDMPKPKVTSRSRSGTPDTRTPQGAGQVSRETHAKLPFSAFSSTASKQVLVEVKTEPSPSNTEEMELLSTGDNEEQNHVEMSPLNMGGGFDDVNSDLDTLDEAPFLAQ